MIVSARYVLTMDDDLGVIDDGAVLVEDGRIAAMGTLDALKSRHQEAELVGGRNMALMPGLVNTHTHAAMSLLRGIADDLPLMTWLERHIWPAENRWMSEGFVRTASRLACLEMIKAGVTTFCDMYFFQAVTADVLREAGMRAVLGSGIIDFPTKTTTGADDCIEKARLFIERFDGDPLVTPSVAAHTPFTCSRETLAKVKKLSDATGCGIQIHLAETAYEVDRIKQAQSGLRPVEYLHDIGLLDERLLASHCVWIDDNEIRLMADHKVNVSHCPESNLKLASGIAPVHKMLSAGINVSLGTDGAASNNDLSVLGEMATAARLHKVNAMDPTVLDAPKVLKMGTRWGSEALCLGGGVIREGAPADLILIDLDKPHLTPIYDIRSHIIYAAQPSDVDTVIIAGRKVMQGRRVLTLDEGDVLQEAREWGRRIAGADEGESS